MASSPTNAGAVSELPGVHPSLRVRGLVILIVVLAEILIGNELAVIGPPYPWSWIGIHIAVGLLLVAITGHAFGLSVRRTRKATAQVSSGVTFLSSLGAVAAGFVFLFGGQSNGALYGMEGLGGLALLGGLLMIVFGSNR